jgi:hypothetical protein
LEGAALAHVVLHVISLEWMAKISFGLNLRTKFLKCEI